MKKTITLFIALVALATLKAQTPKVYYPFDGQSLNSSTGSYPLATVNGSATFTTATHGGNNTHALRLDGSKYEATTFLFDTNATGLTISFWMNRQPNQASGVLVSQLDVVQSGGGMTNYYGTFNTVLFSDGRLVMELYVSSQTSNAITSQDTVPYGWHFVTFKWDGNMKYIYQNGIPTDSSGGPTAIYKDKADVDLRIGAVKYYPMGGQPTFLSPYVGDIDEVRLYESSLSDQQILNLYTNGTINGVSHINADFAVGMFPNPATSYLYFRSPETIERVEVYNMLGESVLMVSNNVRELKIEDLKEGIYTIQLTTVNGIATKKFVKE